MIEKIKYYRNGKEFKIFKSKVTIFPTNQKAVNPWQIENAFPYKLFNSLFEAIEFINNYEGYGFLNKNL